MIEGLLWAFGANEEDEKEVLDYAKRKRTLKDDVPVADLERADRELLIAHAALLTHADGNIFLLSHDHSYPSNIGDSTFRVRLRY